MVPLSRQQRDRTNRQSHGAGPILSPDLGDRIPHTLIAPEFHHPVRINGPDLAGPAFVNRENTAGRIGDGAHLEAVQPTDPSIRVFGPDMAPWTDRDRHHSGLPQTIADPVNAPL